MGCADPCPLSAFYLRSLTVNSTGLFIITRSGQQGVNKDVESTWQEEADEMKEGDGLSTAMYVGSVVMGQTQEG